MAAQYVAEAFVGFDANFGQLTLQKVQWFNFQGVAASWFSSRIFCCHNRVNLEVKLIIC